MNSRGAERHELAGKSHKIPGSRLTELGHLSFRTFKKVSVFKGIRDKR